jgi:hypothetical protein
MATNYEVDLHGYKHSALHGRAACRIHSVCDPSRFQPHAKQQQQQQSSNREKLKELQFRRELQLGFSKLQRIHIRYKACMQNEIQGIEGERRSIRIGQYLQAGLQASVIL